MTVTKPLRDEHEQLLPHIESLRDVADSIGEHHTGAIPGLGDAVDFLTHHLLPHAQAEDAALYPKVEEVMGAPGATATMQRDHVEVAGLIEELKRLRDSLGAEPTPAQLRNLRRLLYGLYAIISLHFAKEEEVYLPILDSGLSTDDAAAMFESMEKHATSQAS